jgi:hypothetical protein
MSYKRGRKSPGANAPTWAKDSDNEKPKRRSFKQWLRDYLKEEPEKIYAVADSISQSHISFAKSFEGWNIRLHRANGGHIVEAWKNEDGPISSSNYKQPHELFMVQDSEDMGERLNSILVQLMLRG